MIFDQLYKTGLQKDFVYGDLWYNYLGLWLKL